jgi:hypothetical protein
LKLLELKILEQASEANHDPPKTVATVKPKVDTQPKPKLEQKPRPEPTPVPEIEPEPVLELEPDPEPEPAPEPELALEIGPESTPEPDLEQEPEAELAPEQEAEIELNRLTELMLEAIAGGARPRPIADHSAASSCISGGSAWQVDIGMLTQSEIMWFYDNWATQLNPKVIYVPEVDVTGEPLEDDGVARVYIRSVDRLLPRRGGKRDCDEMISSKLTKRKVLVAIATDATKSVLDVVEIDREKPEATVAFLSLMWCIDITVGDLNEGENLIF